VIVKVCLAKQLPLQVASLVNSKLIMITVNNPNTCNICLCGRQKWKPYLFLDEIKESILFPIKGYSHKPQSWWNLLQIRHTLNYNSQITMVWGKHHAFAQTHENVLNFSTSVPLNSDGCRKQSFVGLAMDNIASQWMWRTTMLKLLDLGVPPFILSLIQ